MSNIFNDKIKYFLFKKIINLATIFSILFLINSYLIYEKVGLHRQFKRGALENATKLISKNSHEIIINNVFSQEICKNIKSIDECKSHFFFFRLSTADPNRDGSVLHWEMKNDDKVYQKEAFQEFLQFILNEMFFWRKE